MWSPAVWKSIKEVETMKDGKEKKSGSGLAIGMCIGISIGTAVGSATGNIGLWLPVGLCVGMALGMALDQKNGGGDDSSDEDGQ